MADHNGQQSDSSSKPSVQSPSEVGTSAPAPTSSGTQGPRLKVSGLLSAGPNTEAKVAALASLSLMESQVDNAGIASDMGGIRAALKPEPFGDASDGSNAPKT